MVIVWSGPERKWLNSPAVSRSKNANELESTKEPLWIVPPNLVVRSKDSHTSQRPKVVPEKKAETSQFSQKLSPSFTPTEKESLAQPVWSWVRSQPQYPALAKERGWEGIVRIELVSDLHGYISKSQIVHGSGYEVLDAAALAEVQGWRIGANQRVIAPIRFRLR